MMNVAPIGRGRRAPNKFTLGTAATRGARRRRMARARMDAGFTQEEIARELNARGFDVRTGATISNWEKGRSIRDEVEVIEAWALITRVRGGFRWLLHGDQPSRDQHSEWSRCFTEPAGQDPRNHTLVSVGG